MEKLKAVLKSRKFWALVASLVAVWSAVYNGAASVTDGLNLTVAAFAAYSIGTGLDNPPLFKM